MAGSQHLHPRFLYAEDELGVTRAMISTSHSNEPGSHPGLLYSPADLARLRADIQQYGFGDLPGALSPGLLEALQREAESRLGLALFAEQSTDLSYRARLTSLGTTAAALLNGPEARALLRAVFAEELTLSESISCLTFYGEGDYLGAHLDQPAADCAVTILVYLAARGAMSPPSPDTGLVLRVYSEQKPQREDARLIIPTRPGAIVVGRGSRVWHERPQLLPGEQVVALTGCYRRSDSPVAPVQSGVA